MNSQISFVAIVFTVCLSNIHLSTGGSKSNNTLAPSAKPTATTSKSTTNQFGTETTTKPLTMTLNGSTLKPTVTKHETEIPTKLSTGKPTIPISNQSRTRKRVKGTPTKPSTKNSKQKSPISKTVTTTENVAETPTKLSTKNSKQKSPTSKTVTGLPNESLTGKPTTSSLKPTTSLKRVTGTPSKSSTKKPTFKKKSTASKPMTTKNVTGTPSNSSTDTHPSRNNTDPSERTSDHDRQLFRHSNTFPVFFMVILVVIVAVYFTYYNRNKIHKFIKGGFSKSSHGGSGYVKVKLEDGIDLPHEANKNYIY